MKYLSPVNHLYFDIYIAFILKKVCWFAGQKSKKIKGITIELKGVPQNMAVGD